MQIGPNTGPNRHFTDTRIQPQNRGSLIKMKSVLGLDIDLVWTCSHVPLVHGSVLFVALVYGSMLLAGQNDDTLPAAEKPPEVVVVNYKNDDNDDDNDDMVTSFGYDVTEFPAKLFTADAELDDAQKPPFAGLEKFVSRERIELWMSEWRLKMLRNEPESRIRQWVEYLRDRFSRRIVGSELCTRRHSLYRADTRAAPYVGVTPSCGVRNK